MLIRENLIDGVVSYKHKSAGSGLMEKLEVWKSVFGAKPSCAVYIGPAERPPAVVARDKKFFRSCGIGSLVGFHGIDYAPFRVRDPDGNLPRMPHQSRLRMERLALDGVDIRETDFSTPLLHPSQEEREAAIDWLDAHRTLKGKKLFMVGVGSAQPCTAWPFEYFRKLGELITGSGLAEIVVVGGPAERESGEQLVAAWGQGSVAAGQFDVHQMAALLSQADLYAGLDTGTTHLAAAVGTSVIGIYSDHNQPGEWEPMGSGHTILTHRVPCQGCRTLQCQTEGHPCMAGITPEQVFTAIQTRLA